MKATAKTPSRWAVLALTAILRPANAPTALRLNPAAPHRSPSGEGWKKGTARGLSRAEKAAGVRRGPRPAGAAADTAPGQAPSSGHPPATSSRCGPGARPPPGTGTPPPPASRFGHVAEPHECGSEHKQKGGSCGQSPFWLLGWQSSCAGAFSRVQVMAVARFSATEIRRDWIFLSKTELSELIQLLGANPS